MAFTSSGITGSGGCENILDLTLNSKVILHLIFQNFMLTTFSDMICTMSSLISVLSVGTKRNARKVRDACQVPLTGPKKFIKEKEHEWIVERTNLG